MIKMSGRLVVAARVLIGVSPSDLAAAANLAPATLRGMEASGAALLPAGNEVDAIRRALESFGAVFISEGDGMGAGVRLKFTRQDVGQIARLEEEGGITGSDDVP